MGSFTRALGVWRGKNRRPTAEPECALNSVQPISRSLEEKWNGMGEGAARPDCHSGMMDERAYSMACN